MMEPQQGMWILCAPSPVTGVGLQPRRRRLESAVTCLPSAPHLPPPAGRARADRQTLSDTQTPLCPPRPQRTGSLSFSLSFCASPLFSPLLLLHFYVPRAQFTVRTSLKTTTKLAFPQNYTGASSFQLCAGLQDSTVTLFLRHHHRSQCYSRALQVSQEGTSLTECVKSFDQK